MHITDEEFSLIIEGVYTGETMDVMSRKIVRSSLMKRMRQDWADLWVPGMAYIDRVALVKELLLELDRWWLGRNNAACAEYSPCAVAEEIDYALPKTFWKVKRKKAKSVSALSVDPNWKTFENWRFLYPETVDRLRNEAEINKERAEAYSHRPTFEGVE